MIQDVVFTIGTSIFTVSLVPTLRDAQKPPLLTSMPTTIVLATFAISFASLHLWFSAGAAAVECCFWGAVAYQRYSQRPAEDDSGPHVR